MKTVLAIVFTCFLAACGADHGKSVSDKGNKLYYLDPVTEAEAKDVLNWLHETNHNFGEPKAPFQLGKEGSKYIFKYPVQIKDAEKDSGNIRHVEIFATKLSERLKNAPVDVVLMDEHIQVTKKVISSGK